MNIQNGNKIHAMHQLNKIKIRFNVKYFQLNSYKI